MGMIAAFILINVKTGMIDSVIEDIKKVVNRNPTVNTLYADSTTGKFDVFTMIEAKKMEDLHNFIVRDLQGVDGITSTITEVVTHEPPLVEIVKEKTDSLKCYILMTVEVGKINEVLTSLSKATAEDSNVTRVACTTGEYDVIIRIESADVPSLYSFISHAIHVIEGITSTITHIVAREISY
ncbi:MAG: Lrp/AsnC ligand binding domain-containing protein [Candidatus Thermoplasmatota archaeon]|jgi:DNA-binding Lrp family transcriptional regulator|nr:Lrp/AsnC ligand binding domain-containing protein [Candidatus Thermoplasmatota archaeon]